MFRDDIDGLLVWVAKEGDPAIVFDYWSVDPEPSYVVMLQSVNGNMVTQTRYDDAKQALRAFAELMP
jgi:hypothetical protein